MIQRIVTGMLMLALVASAQRRVDPRNMYYRIICVAPYVGQGTAADPIRPKYAPASGVDLHGIIAYTQMPTDDGRLAIVEYVAKDRAVFDVILRDPQIKAFVKGQNTRAEIETEIRKHRRDFNLDYFGVIVP